MRCKDHLLVTTSRSSGKTRRKQNLYVTAAGGKTQSFVFDAWAVLAWLQNEQPAADRVRLLLEASPRERPLVNIVNLGEVFYISVKAKNWAYGEWVLANLRPRLRILNATDELVLAAAGLKARYRISYADAFAAATAIQRGLPLLTGDPELHAASKIESSLIIEWIGA